MPTPGAPGEPAWNCEDLLELAQGLVDACFQREGMLQSEYATLAEAEAGIRFGAEVRALLGAGVSSSRPACSLLTADQWERLRHAVRVALDGQRSPGPVTLELLRAIDETLQQKVWFLFEAKRTSGPLKPGRLFPIGLHNLKALFGKKVSISTRPSTKNLGVEKLQYLGVMPPRPSPYEVRFNYDADAALSTFLTTPVVGALVPNLDFTSEFDMRESGPDRFFDVKPREAETTQRERILDMLEQAEQAGVAVALLPELSVTPELSDALGEWFRHRLGSPLSTLVAGSFHAADGDMKVNRSHAYIASGGPTPRHDKFNPYCMSWKGRTYTEDIKPGPVHLTVHWSRGWSFTTLICKDFIEKTALDLLATLRVNLVFLVALSSETGCFSLGAGSLVHEGQTMTFGVNFGGRRESECAAAIAALPLKGLGEPITYPTRQLDQPRLLVLRLDQFMDGWRPA